MKFSSHSVKILIAFFLFNTLNLFAQKSWQYIGSVGFSTDVASSVKIALDNNDIPFVAFIDKANGKKATVMKYDSQQSSWVTVGVPGFSADSILSIFLEFDSNNSPYVSFCSETNKRLSVMKFDTPNSQWNLVGPEVSPVNAFAWPGDFAISGSNDLYVAYPGVFPNEARVSQYDQGLNQWVQLGTTGLSQPYTIEQTLAIDNNGDIFIAFVSATSANEGTYVMKYDKLNSSWSSVGNIPLSKEVKEPKLAIDNNNVPHLAFIHESKGYRATVLKYNMNSTAWDTLGPSAFSSGFASSLNLSFDNNSIPYVGYSDVGNGSKATIMKFDQNQNNWIPVGTSGFSNASGSVSITFDNSNIPFVGLNDGAGFKASVMKYDVVISLNEITEDFIDVYPIPASHEILISNSHNEPVKAIKLVDTNGKVLFAKELEELTNSLTIPVVQYPNGIYWLQLENETEFKSLKVVIAH